MKRCRQCNHELADEAIFCPKCGHSLATQKEDPMLGKMVADRYVIQTKLGEGGSGTVYKARHVTLKQPVAVKFLHHHLSHDETAIERFRREALTVASIENDHIIDVRDFGRSEDGRFFMVMEFLAGESLLARLKKSPRFSVERAVNISFQVCEALMEAHAVGYVHRDLRPGNIFLINRKGTSDFVKLMDFGLSKLILPGDLPAQSTIGITFRDPRYISPEQARGEKVDRRSDIYSLAVVFYQMLVGEPPFDGEEVFRILDQHIEAMPVLPTKRRPDIPSGLDSVLMKALAKSPDSRYVTVLHFREAVEAALSAPAEGTPSPPHGKKHEKTQVDPSPSETLTGVAVGPIRPAPSDPSRKALPADTKAGPSASDRPAVSGSADEDERADTETKAFAETSKASVKAPVEAPAQKLDAAHAEAPAAVKAGVSAQKPPAAATDAPAEATAEPSTKVPAAASTETPAAALAKAPATASTEAPAASSEAPAESSTEAPAASTEAPAEPSTEATAEASSEEASVEAEKRTESTSEAAEPPVASRPSRERKPVDPTMSQMWYAEGEEAQKKLKEIEAGEMTEQALPAMYEDRLGPEASKNKKIILIVTSLLTLALLVLLGVFLIQQNKGKKKREDDSGGDSGHSAKVTTDARVTSPDAAVPGDASAPATRPAASADAGAAKPLVADPDGLVISGRMEPTRRTGHHRTTDRTTRPVLPDIPPDRPPPTESPKQKAEEHAKLGQQALRSGSLGQAEAHFRKAIKLYSRNGTALAGLGAVAFERGQYTLAIRHLRAALRVSSRTRTLVMLGNAYFKSKSLKQAERIYLQVLKRNPGHGEAKRNLAVVRRRLGTMEPRPRPRP